MSNDQNTVKNCQYIYRPTGQAEEYAPLAANPYRNCGHACAYCYVPGVLHITRSEFDAGATPREDYIHHLINDARKYQEAGITEQVMLSFTTDPYHPGDTSLTRQVIHVLQAHGLGVCTLTKGGTKALRDLDLFRPDRDAFASTLTSLDDDFSRQWERNAALPGDRIAALRAFHDAGIFTWVSLEPTLDVESSLGIIEATHSFVDLFKVGRANYLPTITRTTDWQDYTERVIELCARLGVKHYIKKDLQPYLPAGYYNPMRVAQYHPPSGSLIPSTCVQEPPSSSSTAIDVPLSTQAGSTIITMAGQASGSPTSPPDRAATIIDVPLTALTGSVPDSDVPAGNQAAETEPGVKKAPGEMSSAELVAAIKAPTERIDKQLDTAADHEAQAKQARREAQREFEKNRPLYYEIKRRLLNPGYRADLDGCENRTAEDNQRCFGAPDWKAFNTKCRAYTLRHADRLLREFAVANGLPDTGGNASDPKPPKPKVQDRTDQKRYEHVACAAMEIAKKNPEGEVEKQLLAAAESIPAPLTPLPTDLYTDVLNFVMAVSSSTTDGNLKAEARRLRGKLLLHRPKPEPDQVLGEAQAATEKRRKRNQRLVKKNGGALGSEGYNPPTDATSGQVQRLEPMSDAEEEAAPAFGSPAERKSSFGPSPLKPGKKYEVRPAPWGGYGVYEVGSPVKLQQYPTSEAAWEAIDEVTAIPESVVA